jgi:hypothetical protein
MGTFASLFGFGESKKPEPMNPDSKLDLQCQAVVKAAAGALAGSGVKVAQVHQDARQNAIDNGISCNITMNHVQQAVKDTGKGR